ncbi:MAG: hypothetical protein HXY20_08925 [Acidobacteria bacterium]|nr:hypothetical protein [Acidobacteriota bacterium]
MLEFTSRPNKFGAMNRLAVTIAIFALAAVGVVLYAHYQRRTQPAGSSGPVVIPGMLRPGDPGFEYYKNKIRLENVKAGLGITFNKNRVALVSGIISNEGDRRLEALELHVTLYDLYDKFSKDRTATPLRPGVGLSGPMEPLEKRTFTIGIEGIEQLWNPRRLEVEITGLKYR